MADLRYFLEKIKTKLDEQEKLIQNQNQESRKVIEKYLIDSAEKNIKKQMNVSLLKMGKVISQIPSIDEELYKNYFQQHLHGLILSSPFVKRVYAKPLGYAGDYEVVNMLLRSEYEGGTLFAKIINKYTCDLPIAQAHRNRIVYLRDMIARDVEKQLQSKDSVKVASVGCGPAAEIIEFMKSDTRSERCEITLVDFDLEPLYYCQEKIAQRAALNGTTVRVNIINKSIRDLIKDARIDQNSFGKQDIIYCAGLFDYLTHSTCVRLMELFYGLLEPGGRLVVTNVALSNEFKTYMEFGGEWFLFHRSEDEVLEFSKTLPAGEKIFIDSDDTGVNFFLNVEKQMRDNGG